MNKKILISFLLVSCGFLSACIEQQSDDQTADLECLDYKTDIDSRFETNSQALKSDEAGLCRYLIEISKEDLKKDREEMIEFEKYYDSLFSEEGESQDVSEDHQ